MTNKKEMGLGKYPYHSNNPFLNAVIQQITEKKTRKIAGFKFQDVVDLDTGQVEKQTMMVLGESRHVDKAEFAKVFRDGFKFFYGLSEASLKLVDYISENIKYNNDKICLIVSDIIEQKAMGYTTVYRSITQLLEKKLLAKADMTGCYYINPQVFFKGDRLVLVKQYIREEGKQKPIKKLK